MPRPRKNKPTKHHHAEWLSLLEISGPFVSIPVLQKVFPQGLDAHDPEHARSMRLAFEEWENSQSTGRDGKAIHNAWVQFVLRETLGLPDDVIATGQSIPQTLKASVAEHGVTLRPDVVIRNPDGVPDAGKPRLLVQVYPSEQKLENYVTGSRWKAYPSTRMMTLCHTTETPLGLVTNGARWMLVYAPRNETTGFASWYANLWLEEPITLRAFRSLFAADRFFGAQPGQTLEEMLAESAMHQQEVTDQLGLQVRQAVEVLIQSLDRAYQYHGRELLGEIPETVLYEAALTVMMRLVFLFCAEERELLLLGDPLYDEHYAVSTLVARLQETADQQGEEILERRLDAWSRLLSTFRAVYGGVQHERMKLQAYAGNLFDPDRFPFLEGRKLTTSWKETPANPLPVNNRTILHLLRSLQYLQAYGEAQRISFRALGIEQIGHVYEGLLDHTAKRAQEPILGLSGTMGKEPEIALSDLEQRQAKNKADCLDFLKKETGRSERALTKALGIELEGEEAGRLRVACGNDETLFERVSHFAGLIRDDSFDRPVVIRGGSVFVTAGTDRRTSGTHYTPTSLTEPIVKHTLDPLCYSGPAEGKSEREWKLRSARELLDLKICDMACGSGAFLVQACRYLSDLLVEAWEQAEKLLPGTIRITPYGESSEGAPSDQPIPLDTEERLTYARRLVAERCLYGVDKNALAVEMAKLSLWLLTLAKDKPFTFLNHAIRRGDSLVGISSIEQLLRFSLSEDIKTRPLQHRQEIDRLLDAVNLLRTQIEAQPSNTPQDIERKAAMLKSAEEQTLRLTYAADFLLAESWQPMNAAERQTGLNSTLVAVEQKLKDLPVERLDADAKSRLRKARVEGRFHWPLEYPEVFSDRGGFDGFVCNPPFMWGKAISGQFGRAYRAWLVEVVGRNVRGNPDLCAFFFLRVQSLLRRNGTFGLVATNTIAQGDTREVSLDRMLADGITLYRTIPSCKWPGSANLEVAHVWGHVGRWRGSCRIDSELARAISPYLRDTSEVVGPPHRLERNRRISFQGSIVLGKGFMLSHEEAQDLIRQDAESRNVLFPYLNGVDLNSRPDQSPSRCTINFSNWPLRRSSKESWSSATQAEQELWLKQGLVSYDYPKPVAEDFGPCIERVRRLVLPERLKSKRKAYRTRWWQYAERQTALYDRLAAMKRTLATAQTTKYLSFTFVPTNIIFSNAVIVLLFDDDAHFALFSSSLHESWTREYCSSLETRLRFVPTDGLETFPFPTDLSRAGRIGAEYLRFRSALLQEQGLGMTDCYNRFHDPDDAGADIQGLRDLHVEMDRVVANAYDWDDLDLGHGFHKTKQGVRYTISETARREVLQRLLKLNHERYAEEVRQGLHDKKAKGKKSGARRGRKKKVASGPLLFGDEEENGG